MNQHDGNKSVPLAGRYAGEVTIAVLPALKERELVGQIRE